MDGCLECGGALGGHQRKFCSRQCKGSWHNRSHQSYLAQQRRGRKRKLLLIEMLGFACCHCGYARNSAALEFHHVIPGDKDFALDLRALSNRRWQSILSEVGKCILLCSNCHAERHNPGCALASKADATVTGGV